MTPILSQKLAEFRTAKKVIGKGNLATVLFLTRRIAEDRLPFVIDKLRTARQGQVAGLGREPVQKILADYKITRTLAEEGGRTSRGSLGLANDYVVFLNELHKSGILKPSELKNIEAWWVEQVREYFNRKAIKLNLDPSITMSSLVAGLLEEARKRQAEMEGLRVEGAVLHYLVGAKLRLVFPKSEILVRGFSVADGATADKGDFLIGDTVVHATTAPSEKLLSKCQENITAGLRPLIVCPSSSVPAAISQAGILKIRDRVEILDAEMFVSTNVNERGCFESAGIQQSARDLIRAYNAVIEEVESDHSLKIETK